MPFHLNFGLTVVHLVPGLTLRVLSRLYSMILDLSRAQDQVDALKKQAENQSKVTEEA